MMFRRFFFLLALLLAPTLAQARGIEPQLIAEGPAPAGGEVELAIHMRTNPGWHGYWLNPGDAGLPMDVQWQLPPGFAAGPLRYPVPDRLTMFGLMNYVYERDYAVLVRLKVPVDVKGVVPIRANARWLACTDKVCVPESGALSLDVAVGPGPPANRARFDEWRRALPRPLATPARFEIVGQKLRVAIPLPRDIAVGEPYVFPIADGAIDYAAPQHFRRSGDTLIAELDRRAAVPREFAGLLELGDGQGFEFKAALGAVPEGGQALGEYGARAIMLGVLGAIVGGLLLNLMPCVFPILALKALHLANSGGEANHARRDALSYTAGAVVGTGALGGVLLAIRAGGSAAGWAFQLQDPRTIMLLLLLATAITANLIRIFEVPVLVGRTQPAGSFGTGALAAFIATPCAGPFLGAALGTALLLPLAGSVLVFAALGLGLAIPFVVVAFVPVLRNKLPKPGAWMVKLQRVLAIPMAASAAACLWLLYRLAGWPALLFGLFAMVALVVCLSLAGRIQRGGRRQAVFVFGLSLLVVLAAVARVPIAATARSASIAGAVPWSESLVAAHLQQGRPVFVYFTADWCLTCKANEVAAIDRSEVRDAFRKAGVRVVAGDWTNGDPPITRFLESRGRAGVPLYLWYRPGGQVEELPQILTPAMLISRARSQRR